MKCKLYLRMVLAAMTALFVATGCSSGTDEPIEPVGPVDVPVTFELQVSNVGTGEATVAVKPSKLTAMYYCDAITKTAFDAYATDEAFLAADIKRLEAIATAEKMTLKAYLEMYGNRGEKNVTVETTEPKTAYYAYVYGIKNDGTVISKVFKAEFVSGEKPILPVLRVTLQAGKDGANKATQMTGGVWVTESPAVSGKYFMAPTAYVEEQIAAGKTYESLVAELDDTFAFNEDQLTKMNSTAGYGLWFGSAAPGLTPNTSYTLIIRVLDAKGTVAVSHAAASTEPSSGGGGPTVTVTLAPGQYMQGGAIGGDPTTQVHIIVESEPMNVTAGKIFIDETAGVQANLDKGFSYEDIINELGENLDASTIANVNAGGVVFNFKAGAFKPGTSYTAIALLTNPSGTSVGHGAGSTTGGGGGGSLTFTFAVTEITATAAKIQVTPSNNTDTYYFDVIESSQIAGKTDAEIVAACGDLPSKYPSTGPDGYNPSAFEKYPLATGVEHTVFAFGYASGAATTPVAKSTFTPTGGGPASDAYKAWLGTWTVTSTSSESTQKALVFDITIEQKTVNSTYTMVGLTTSVYRDDPSKNYARFPVAKFVEGKFTLENQVNSKLNDEDGTGEYIYNVRYKAPDGRTFVDKGSGYVGMTGTLKADKISADLIGSNLTNDKGEAAGTVLWMDLFYWYYTGSSKDKIYGTSPGVGFVAGQGIDYPIGPYTMTKKSGAAAPAKSMGINSALSTMAVNKSVSMSAKSVVIVSNIPQLSSMLKLSSMSKASNGLNVPSVKAEMSASALEVAPMSAKATIYKAIPME